MDYALTPQSLSVAKAERNSDQREYELRQAGKTAVIKRMLREAAPASLSQYLLQNKVIDALLAKDEWEGVIVYGSGNPEFKSATQTRESFLALRAAWRDAIRIEFVNDKRAASLTVKLTVP